MFVVFIFLSEGKRRIMYELKKEQEYELFRNKISEAVSEYYGEEYRVKISRANKLNGVVLYGINITEKDRKISPTIYLEGFFKKYERGIAFSSVFKEIVDTYERFKNTDSMTVDFFMDYEKVKSNLSIKLINTELNKELLKDVPHRIFDDLAIVCIVEVKNKDEKAGTVLIHNNHICMWGVHANELIDDALKNATKIAAPRINKLSDVVLSLYDHCTDEERRSVMKQDMELLREEPLNMFILSNSDQTFGASVITYPDLLKGIGESLKSDFYVLPSSVHEVIILPKFISGTIGNINSMIRSINSEMLNPEDVLSDHAYLFSVEDNRLVSVA